MVYFEASVAQGYGSGGGCWDRSNICGRRHAEALLERMVGHYAEHAGDSGFSDEATVGEAPSVRLPVVSLDPVS